MGQKVNPVGLRLGINRTWDSRWFADGRDYGRLLHEDVKVRRELKKRLYQAGVSRIVIERPHKKCRITIYAARPGVIIGKKGADIEKLRNDVAAVGEPARVPGAVDAEPQPDRIDFLTHQAASPSSRTTMVISENGFSIREARPRARGEKRFMTRFLPT